LFQQTDEKRRWPQEDRPFWKTLSYSHCQYYRLCTDRKATSSSSGCRHRSFHLFLHGTICKKFTGSESISALLVTCDGLYLLHRDPPSSSTELPLLIVALPLWFVLAPILSLLSARQVLGRFLSGDGHSNRYLTKATHHMSHQSLFVPDYDTMRTIWT
jgi:hypothetical protein